MRDWIAQFSMAAALQPVMRCRRRAGDPVDARASGVLVWPLRDRARPRYRGQANHELPRSGFTRADAEGESQGSSSWESIASAASRTPSAVSLMGIVPSIRAEGSLISPQLETT